MLGVLLLANVWIKPSLNPVLILVQPGLPRLFEPEVDPDTFVHGTWVRWPEEARPPDGNRLLSVATGRAWQGEPSDFRFKKTVKGWQSENYPALAARGHFEARDRVWGQGQVMVLENENGGIRPRALMLALGGTNRVSSVPLDWPWPEGKTMVIEAQLPSEIAEVKSHTDGPVLLVEYPPPAGRGWSRLWTVGKGWPDGLPVVPALGVPGLVSAESVGRLLTAPESVKWVPQEPRWPGANRWLTYAQSGRPAYLIPLGAIAFALAVAGAYLIGQERRSATLASALRVLALTPAALVVAGNLALIGGLTGSLVWFFVALLAMSGLAALTNLLLKKTGARGGMLGYAAVGLAALLVTDPRFSVFSGALGRWRVDIPPEPLGAMLAYFTVVLGQSGSLRKLGWFGGIAITVVLLTIGIALPVWWKGSVGTGWAMLWLVPAGLWLSRGRWAQLAAGFAGGAVVAFRLASHGYVFAPYELLSSVRQVGGVNSFEFLRFLTSPLFLISALLAGAFTLFGAGFFNYQIRQTWLLGRSPRLLLSVAAFLSVVGLAYPAVLDAALVAALGSVLVLFESLLNPD